MNEIKKSSKELFAITINRLCAEENLDIIDGIVAFADRNEIQIEEIIPMLDTAMREEIRVQAIRGRYVRGMKLNELQF